MGQVNGLRSGRESRQDVVQNDKISLGDIVLQGVRGGGVQVSKTGCTRIRSLVKFTVLSFSLYDFSFHCILCCEFFVVR